MEVVNPSVMVSRLDLAVLDTTAARIDFSSTPVGFLEYWVLIDQRGGPGGTRGGHNPPGRTWASWRALVGCAFLGAPP